MKKVLLWFFALVVLGVGAGLVWWFFLQPKKVVETPASPKTKVEKATKVAYIKDNNVYTNAINGGTEAQLTKDGSKAPSVKLTYALPRFVDSGKLAYLKCEDPATPSEVPKPTCSILEQDLITGGVATITSDKAVSLFDWSGTNIAYYTSETEKTRTIVLYDTATKASKQIASYAPNLGRGVSNDDSSDLRFAPDGKHLLFYSTVLYPTTKKGTPNFQIFSIPDGVSKYSSVPKGGIFDYTFAQWVGSDTVVYKTTSAGIYSYSLTTGKTTQINKDEARQLAVSHDGKTIAYWTNAKKGTTLWTADAISGKATKLADLKIDPFFLDNSSLAAQDTKLCTPTDGCDFYDFYNGYVSAGTTTRITTADGKSVPYFFTGSSIDADVLWEIIEV